MSNGKIPGRNLRSRKQPRWSVTTPGLWKTRGRATDDATPVWVGKCGDYRDRTDDLLNANQMLSQLS